MRVVGEGALGFPRDGIGLLHAVVLQEPIDGESFRRGSEDSPPMGGIDTADRDPS
jgi:hypothetical protein